jgi:hypothetical protein
MALSIFNKQDGSKGIDSSVNPGGLRNQHAATTFRFCMVVQYTKLL